MQSNMDRIDRILGNGKYRHYLELNKDAETGRIFCRHDMGHFLDVARIGWILVLEEGLPIEKETVYAAALLHDIGRHLQYAEGVPHEKASAALALEILKECGFDDKETDVIIRAIGKHRDRNAEKEENLNGILYRADKASRTCFCCEAEAMCDWKQDKKNKRILY